ncbi:uncharacterized protein LOC121879122 [Homarus americanus]|uniref:Methyltransferase-like protein 24-like 4 n=1 Tax=Homarus americanus TaxID=6706 RepID=A0A8J5JMR1_HOMAM|nr:uncharacterized protein LOC121879122 [Homarus americanus]KAG7158219.1 Methyltransferase-like protein 24-like 4 [Homarus americanus]
MNLIKIIMPKLFIRRAVVCMAMACVLVVVRLLDTLHLTHSSGQYRRFWTSSAHLVEGKYVDEYLPFLVFPVLEEKMMGGNILEEALPGKILLVPVVPRPTRPLHDLLNYLQRSLPPMEIQLLQEGANMTQSKDRLETINDYYRYLQTPQVSCHKLVKLGGAYCMNKVDDKYHFDGHKCVCMDPELEMVGARDTHQCLTLSFGTQRDTTFDDAASDLPCEVHMFDIFNYNPQLTRENNHTYFHVVGLSNKRIVKNYININTTVEMDTLRGHVMRNNLFPRPIHVLKVDIELGEWDAFRDIVQDPLFDAVGQVTMEVHTFDLSDQKMSLKKKLEVLQERYDVLRMIEARGFRRVLYWDNDLSRFPLYDEGGIKHVTAGELLYLNTNWYNATFKQSLATEGFTFRHHETYTLSP